MRPLVVLWREQIADSAIPFAGKAVAHGLSRFMNAEGACRLSRATIADACSCSLRTVDTWVARLELLGVLVVDRTIGGNPKTCTNGYQAKLSGEPPARVSGERRAGVPVQLVHSAANVVPLSSEPPAPEQVIEEQEGSASQSTPDEVRQLLRAEGLVS